MPAQPSTERATGAREVVQVLLRVQPGLPTGIGLQAELELKTGDVDDETLEVLDLAVDQAARSLQHRHGVSVLLAVRARALLALGRTDEARQQASEVDPDAPEHALSRAVVHFHLSELHAALGDDDAARLHAEATLELAPETVLGEWARGVLSSFPGGADRAE